MLLAEAGPADRNPWLHIPSGFFRTINNPRFDWRYETEPEPPDRLPHRPPRGRSARRIERH